MSTEGSQKRGETGLSEELSLAEQVRNAQSRQSQPSRRNFLLTGGAGLAALSLSFPQAEAAQENKASDQVSAAARNECQLPYADYLKRSFVVGREYFFLRSGRVELIVQADRADIWPAFLWLGFDSRASKKTHVRQTIRKENALNFDSGTGFLQSALEVVLGGFPFTALSHETETRWVWIEGIPAVEAQWWAGGVLVTEHLFALDSGLFVRRVTLDSRNLAGADDIFLRLSHPAGEAIERDGWLIRESADSRMALGSDGTHPRRLFPQSSKLEIGPLVLQPGESVSVDTWLAVAISPGENPWTVPSNISQSTKQTSEAWSSTSSIATDDTTVREIFDKARIGLAGLLGDDGSIDCGVFEYGMQWVRDTSATMTGLLHCGHFELARAGLLHLLDNLVDSQGRTMVASSFDEPDREELDQMGELFDALRSYVDWTGDDSLVREYRSRLVPMVERPLLPEFQHASGMVHNRREFWEREFDDGFELIYQIYVALGLRRAASLANPLGAGDRSERWLREADRILAATLHDPKFALVEDGHLIKRRSLSGERVLVVHETGAYPDVPAKTERVSIVDPDTQSALAIAIGVIDPRSALAHNSLDELEKLWNGRWFGGGYDRYHSSSETDQPGPWTFATCFLLRAQHDAGLFQRSRRSLEWLNTVQGGRAGAWFEEIPIIRSQAPTSGILPWTSAEVAVFVSRHLLGARFEEGELLLRPNLFPGSPEIKADLRFRKGRLKLEIPGPGPFQYAIVNGQRVPADPDGAIRLGKDFEGGSVSLHV